MTFIKKIKKHLSLILSLAMIFSLISSLDFEVVADTVAVETVVGDEYPLAVGNSLLKNPKVKVLTTSSSKFSFELSTQFASQVCDDFFQYLEDNNLSSDFNYDPDEMDDIETETNNLLNSLKAQLDIVSKPPYSSTSSQVEYSIKFAARSDDTSADATGFTFDTTAKETFTNDDNIIVGDYSISYDDLAKEYTLTFRYYDYALLLSPQNMTFSFECRFSNNSDTDASYNISYKGTTFVATRVDDNWKTPDVTDDDDYKIEKEVVDSDSVSVKYKVKVTAPEDKNLNGCTLKDIGPSNSVYSASKFRLDNVSMDDIPLTVAAYYNTLTGVFEYTFTAPSQTEAEFILEYYLGSDILQEFFTNGINISGVVNTAELWGDVENAPTKLADDTSDEVGFNASYISKDCVPDNNNSSKLKWTIKINTAFTHMSDAYLIDYISSENQKYTGNITVKYTAMNTMTYTLSGTTENAVISQINAKQTEMDTAKKASTYVTGDVCTVIYDSAAEKYGIVIPLTYTAEEGNTALGGTYEITYYTMLDESDHDTNVTSGGKIDALNDAFVVFNHMCVGDGVGNCDFSGTIKIDKSYEVSYDVYKKKPLPNTPYNAAAQVLTWQFDINRFGVAYDYIIIEDTLDLDMYAFTGDIADKKPIKAIKYDMNGIKAGEIVLEYEVYTGATDHNYYTISDDTIYFCITGISKDNYYLIDFPVKVVDAKFLSTETGMKAENISKASFQITGGAAATYNAAKAECSISNKLLEKRYVTDSYNYNDFTMQWTITANHNNVSIKDLVLTDTLPVGTTFVSVDSIEIGTDKVTAITGNSAAVGTMGVSWTVDNTTKNLNDYSTGNVEFEFDSVCKNKVIIVLTIKIDENFRRLEMAEYKNIEFQNFVKMIGKVTGTNNGIPYDEEISSSNGTVKSITANDKAYIKNSRIIKNGEISGSEVLWKAYINTDKVDLSGKFIWDDLRNYNYLEMCLDTPAVEAFALTVNADGTFTEGVKITDPAFEPFYLDYDGFKIAIPDDYATTPFVIKFITTITGKPNSALSNTLNICLTDDDVISDYKSADISTQSYDYKSGCDSSTKPKLVLTKIDIDNQVITAPVNFQLQYSRNNKDFFIKRITDNGIANFTNLPSDILLTLTEIGEPSGYIHSDEELYFVFLKNMTEAQYKQTQEYLDFSNKDKIIFSKYVNGKNAATARFVNLKAGETIIIDDIKLIKNFDDPNLTTMTDTDARDALLADVEFTLYTDDEYKTIFNTKSPVWSDLTSEAVVTFRNNLSGAGLSLNKIYYLKETKAPVGYNVSDDVYMCKVGPDGKVTYKLAADVDGDFTDICPGCLNNILLKTDITFKNKTTLNIELENTLFGLYNLNGTLFAMRGRTFTEYTDTNGDITFYDVPEGKYYIQEISLDVNGYLLNTRKFYVTVSNNNGVAEVDFDGDISLTVYNEPVSDPDTNTKPDPNPDPNPNPEPDPEPNPNPNPNPDPDPEPNPDPDPNSNNNPEPDPNNNSDNNKSPDNNTPNYKPHPNDIVTDEVSAGAGFEGSNNLIDDAYDLLITNTNFQKLCIIAIIILGNIYVAVSKSKKKNKGYSKVN